MKLQGAAAARYPAAPDATKAALLIHGDDTSRVQQKRAEATAALAGPGAEAEMRLTRLPAAEARRDPAALGDALRSPAFFPGPRVVVVDDATDGMAPMLADALADWRPGDAHLMMTAAALPAKSALRKVAEDHPACVCIAVYDDPPGPDEIAAELARAGVPRPEAAVLAEIAALGRMLDAGDFRRTLERVALYKLGDPSPLTVAEVESVAPLTAEADDTDLAQAVVEERANEIPRLLRRLIGQGATPVGTVLAVQRVLRAMPGTGADQGAMMARGRAVPFRLRDVLARSGGNWPGHRVESALAALLETDAMLRSSNPAPDWPLVERTLLRIAMRGR